MISVLKIRLKYTMHLPNMAATPPEPDSLLIPNAIPSNLFLKKAALGAYISNCFLADDLILRRFH